MRIIVTGATSMLGAALIKDAVDNGAEVAAIVRPNTPKLYRIPKSENVQIIQKNIPDIKADDFKYDCYDSMYHFAWNGTSRKDRASEDSQLQNIEITKLVLKLTKDLKCKRFICSGSQAEYGIVQTVIDEDTPLNPITEYGIAKNKAHEVAKQYCQNNSIKCIWLRVFSVFGVYATDDSITNYQIDCFLNNDEAHFSAATHTWNLLYQTDAGKMLYLLTEQNVDGGTYCFAHNKSKPLKEYILECGDACNATHLCNFANSTNDKVVSLDVCTKKLNNAINYYPQASYKEAYLEILEYRRAKKNEKN